MISFDGRLKISNDILKKLGANFIIESVDEINCNFFIRLYQLLFRSIPNGVIEASGDDTTDVSNMGLLLKELSMKVLHVSLSHIRAENVVRGDCTAVTNILEIFQGLAQCVRSVRNPPVLKVADRDSRRLKCTIRNTQRQTDNLVEIAERVLEGPAQRSEYLQRKIREILRRRGGDSSLRDYVDDNKDELILMRGLYGNTSSSPLTEEKGEIHTGLRESTRKGDRTSKCKGDLSVRSTCLNGRSEYEDELTMVTGYDYIEPGTTDSDSGSYLSDSSRNTYLLSSRTVADETKGSRDLESDGKIKDAWAQVSKELIHDGYENEFLEMLLNEDESRGKKKGYPKGSVPLQSNSDNRPMSAFDDFGAKGGFISQRSLDPGPRGGLVRPVIKHIGHKTKRSDLVPMSTPSNSARSVPASEDDRSDIMSRLLEEFPGLSLSDQALRLMWSQAARQAANIQRVQQEFVSRLGPGEQRVEDSRRRQQMLFNSLRKEALHQVRLRERVEERESQCSLKASKEKQRQQSAKAKRYYEEYSQRMRARMVQKQAREEQVFRSTFQAALKLQRERINDLRRYAKEKKDAKFSQHQKELDSLENYYRDRFSMLAECLRGERQQLRLQDKSQEQGLHKRKQEIRVALEKEIRQVQDSMVCSEHEAYFRGLDADQAVSTMALE